MKTNLFDYSEFWIFIRRNIPLLAINFFLIVAVAIYYSFFFVKKEYVSSLSFLAPQESSSISNLLQIGGMNNYNSNDMPQQIEPIFSSKTLKENH